MCARLTPTNDSVLKMVKGDLGEDVIVSMIQNQPGHCDLTPDALKSDGLSDKVPSAMAAKNNAGTTAPPVIVDAYEDLEPGVYHKMKDMWTPIATEPVNWKTGGVLKSIAAQGIVKEDVRRASAGPRERNKDRHSIRASDQDSPRN